MIRRKSSLLLLLLSVASCSGCGWVDRVRDLLETDTAGDVALEVGERTYTQADLTRFFESRLSDFRDPQELDKVRSRLLDTFIEERLLLHQAEKLKVEPSRESLESMLAGITATDDPSAPPAGDEDFQKSLVESLKMQRYLNEHLLKNLRVSDEECEAHYQAHLSDYVVNDVVHVREILVGDRSLAEKLLESLKANRNKNFGELARVHSLAPSAANGGDMGVFERGDLPDDFEKAIFSLSPGTTSRILQTKFGFHLFLVEEKVLAHQQKFYQVRERIRDKLSLERQREAIEKEVQSLMNHIPVRVHREQLGFDYSGSRFPALGGIAP